MSDLSKYWASSTDMGTNQLSYKQESAVSHRIDIAGVASSILATPTINPGVNPARALPALMRNNTGRFLVVAGSKAGVTSSSQRRQLSRLRYTVRLFERGASLITGRGSTWRGAPLLAAIASLLAWPSTASAGCVWSDLVRVDTRVAVVRPGTPRVHFVDDGVLRRDCPDARAGCRLRSFVVPGDVVLIGHRQGAFTCAGFQGLRGGGTIGWLPVSALSLLPPAAQRPQDWAGHWVAPEQDLTITVARGGALTVAGEASWGMDSPELQKIGGVHIGQVNGTARPIGGLLSFAEGDGGRTLPYARGDEFSCRIKMIRRGPYLLVRDNKGCGGMNVSFSGFYARARR